MTVRRALRRRVRRRRSGSSAEAPPRFWGWVGAYEAVTREGVLFLLGPEPVHPTMRVKARGRPVGRHRTDRPRNEVA